jgi:hypothetical protein
MGASGIRELLCLARNSVILVRYGEHGNETSGSKKGEKLHHHASTNRICSKGGRGRIEADTT